MIIKLFNFLFKSNSDFISQDKQLNALKKHPNFKSKEEIQKSIDYGKELHNTELTKNEVKVISVPALGDCKVFEVTNWIKKNGDIVKSGDIICEIENAKVIMELESYYSGLITETCDVHVKLNPGNQLCKIIGIK